MKLFILGVVLACVASTASAACPDISLMQNAARGWIAGQRLPDPLVQNLDDANCAYASFRGVLQAELGPPVGVKVALISPDNQARFGLSAPITGAFFAPMLISDGSKLSLHGSRNPMYAVDLVFTIGDAAIMQARSRADVVASLRDVRPFIELPDFALPLGVRPSGPLLAAYGVTPWRGVLGKGIAISEMGDPIADIGAMSVVFKVDGRVVETPVALAMPGHPLDVVLWLVAQRSYELKPGSIISLGLFGTWGEAAPGKKIDAEYNLAGRVMRASVTLTP